MERKPMMPRGFTIHSARSFFGGCSRSCLSLQNVERLPSHCSQMAPVF
jgi:hypothetical protein